ncbi:MAG: hypothetical protein AAFR93_08925 [Pseudomonadota bacterium]
MDTFVYKAIAAAWIIALVVFLVVYLISRNRAYDPKRGRNQRFSGRSSEGGDGWLDLFDGDGGDGGGD